MFLTRLARVRDAIGKSPCEFLNLKNVAHHSSPPSQISRRLEPNRRLCFTATSIEIVREVLV